MYSISPNLWATDVLLWLRMYHGITRMYFAANVLVLMLSVLASTNVENTSACITEVGEVRGYTCPI